MKTMLPKILALTLIVAQFAGCGIGYYWQATTGHLKLMRQRRPVPEVVADPDTAPEVRSALERATEAVDFAHTSLMLPDNGSYRSYADTGRPYVVWNVFAAPEFSLEPRTWCFPVAGCVSYRGYFDATTARKFAERLAEQGDDVFVGGVAAYSTLGRFADPLLNTMMDFSDDQLAGLIFHELAHQRLYVEGDSKFNEGFASFIEQEGLYRQLRSIEDNAALSAWRLSVRRQNAALGLLSKARAALAELYAREVADAEKRLAKAAIFSSVRQAYSDLRRSWSGPPYFDHWFDARLNNARIAAMATYDDFVPAFRALLEEHGGDLGAFYARVEAIAELPEDKRIIAMQALLDSR